MSQEFPFAAVLTGDLVASRRAAPVALSAAMETLSQATQDIAEDAHVSAGFDRHRGDGWQVILSEGETGLRAALRLVAALAASDHGIATRIAIGLGPATLPASGDPGAAYGPALLTAGDMLDHMDRHSRLSLTPEAGAPFGAMTGLLDWQSRGWTGPQAAALFEALRNSAPTQDEIAARFGVTRQAIQRRLAPTGLPALRDALRVFESKIEDACKTPPETSA